MVRVSVITPTRDRATQLEQMFGVYRAQTHIDKELLIVDDSAVPNPFFAGLSNSDVSYIHSPTRLTVGAKRNALARRASGDVIVHFDDDDYYAPDYLAAMLDALGDLDFVKLSAWFLADPRRHFFGYWDCAASSIDCHRVFPIEPTITQQHLDVDDATRASQVWGYGFSYVYRRAICNCVSFTDIDFGEDFLFVRSILDAGLRADHFADESGIVLHVIHSTNLSGTFPQYKLPSFLLSVLFPGAAQLP